MAAAFKVLLDVLVYRLRRREMANLAGALSLAVVLGLGMSEIARRFAFGLLLNVLVYLNNDCCDLALDSQDPSKDPEKTRYLREHRGAAIAAQLALVAVLVGLSLLWDPYLLVPFVLGAGVCWAYSARLKRVPGFDVLAMVLWGATMPLVGTPLDRLLGLVMAVALGLFSGVFESIQVLRDRQEDEALGVRTTAVALGARRTLLLARALTLAAAGFVVAALDPFAGLLIALAALLPCSDGGVPRYWDRVRMVFGAAWLLTCARIFLTGGAHGLALELPLRASVVDLL
ncbi:MAG: UbiA family prenyltransferase [Nannocystaceae bacterium]|nr:UbiA family prenyltransferase [Myxococcales bacterium]